MSEILVAFERPHERLAAASSRIIPILFFTDWLVAANEYYVRGLRVVRIISHCSLIPQFEFTGLIHLLAIQTSAQSCYH